MTGKRRRYKFSDLPPVVLGSVTPFSGSYSLTSTLTDIGASGYTLTPSSWAIPAGYTSLQYRYNFTFSGNTSNLNDRMECWERRTAGTPFYYLGGGVYCAGWRDVSNWQFHLVSTGSPAPTVNPSSSLLGYGVTLSGSDCLTSVNQINIGGSGKPFAVECSFSRSRTLAGVETLIGLWQSSGLFVAYFSADTLTVTNSVGTVAAGSTTATGGMHWFAYTWDGTTARAYLDGTRFMNQTNTPTSQNCNLEIGANDSGSNKFQGFIGNPRISILDARYTGTSYTVPAVQYAVDTPTIAQYPLDAAPSSTPVCSTGWTAFPTANTDCDLAAINKDASRGTLSTVQYEVRAVA